MIFNRVSARNCPGVQQVYNWSCWIQSSSKLDKCTGVSRFSGLFQWGFAPPERLKTTGLHQYHKLFLISNYFQNPRVEKLTMCTYIIANHKSIGKLAKTRSIFRQGHFKQARRYETICHLHLSPPLQQSIQIFQLDSRWDV